MIRTLLFAKIHRATVTAANVHYVGSITIDKDLLGATGIHEYERVQVVDVDNGNRLETYVIEGPRGQRRDRAERRGRPARQRGRQGDHHGLRDGRRSRCPRSGSRPS